MSRGWYWGILELGVPGSWGHLNQGIGDAKGDLTSTLGPDMGVQVERLRILRGLELFQSCSKSGHQSQGSDEQKLHNADLRESLCQA